MSVAVMTWVFNHSQSKGSARLVLLAMADEAANTGELSAYRRSQSWIAKKANVTVRSVRDSIDALVAIGELEVLKEGIGREQSDYRIVMREEQSSSPREEQISSGEERGSSPSSRSLPVEPVETISSQSDETFEKFWKNYPRRQGTSKKRAASAFKSAVKRGHLDQIREGFKRDVATWTAQRRSPEHIPHASTWLNEERYMAHHDTPLTTAAYLADDRDLDAEHDILRADGTPWPKWTRGFWGSDEVPSWTDRRGNRVYEDPTL